MHASFKLCDILEIRCFSFPRPFDFYNFIAVKQACMI